MKAVGGNSVLSGGIVSCPCSDEQISNHYKDSKELFLQDLLKVGEHINDVELVKILADNILNDVNWTKEVFKLKFRPKVVHFGGHSVPRSLQMEKGRGHDLGKTIL